LLTLTFYIRFYGGFLLLKIGEKGKIKIQFPPKADPPLAENIAPGLKPRVKPNPRLRRGMAENESNTETVIRLAQRWIRFPERG
jgi:hypothetical protein